MKSSKLSTQWIAPLKKGDRLALSRLITKIENQDKDALEILKAIFPLTGRAMTIGITGPPGSGKSTLVDQLVACLRKEGKKVGVLAIDPSSPFTGGAILGDRVRMQRHATDDGVFIRSLGTRGQQGGLSACTLQSAWLMDAAGYDVIIIETAGVGQTELEIMRVVQSVGVVLVPESGDGIQVMKAGVMEIADLFILNKSDRPEADRLFKELQTSLAGVKSSGWKIPVTKTQAEKGEGVKEVLKNFLLHHSYLKKSRNWELLQTAVLRHQVITLLSVEFLSRAENALSGPKGKTLMKAVLARKMDPATAAGKLRRLIK